MKFKVFSALMLSVLLFLCNVTPVFSTEVNYSFDKITLLSAFHFDILCNEDPEEDSFFYDKVLKGETISVYVGNLRFDDCVGSDSQIVILTNNKNQDICKWILNSYQKDNNKEVFSFSSHIKINPNMGITKNLDDKIFVAQIEKSNYTKCSFTAIYNNKKITYTMIQNTYKELNNLNIKVFTGGEAK